MKAYWSIARSLLDTPWTLGAAIVCAIISGLGVASGLLMVVPVLELTLGKGGRSLASLAAAHNAVDTAWPIPEWLLPWLPATTDGSLAAVLGGLALLTVVGAAANYAHQYLTLTMVTRIIAQLRADVFAAAIRMPLVEVIHRGPSDLTSRIIRDCSEVYGGLVALTNRSLAQVTKGLAAFGVAVYYDWRIVLAALIAGPPLAITLRKLGKRINRGMRGTLEAQQELLLATNEALQGLRSVKASTAERDAVRRFNEANASVLRHERRLRRARSLAGPVMELLAVFVVLALVLVAGRELVTGRLQLDRFLLALGSLAVAAGSMRPLAAFASDIQSAEAPARRLRDVLDAAPEPGSTGGEVFPRLSKSIDVEGVSFSYPDATRPSLLDVSVSIPVGAHVAIVGPNGCGKSTLLALIPALVQPTAGRVLVDGRELRHASLAAWRAQIGMVSQEAMLVRGSIAENIALGTIGMTRERVIDAAKRAHAHEFIQALPQGYDTLIAEQGLSLSGGQRQRVAIARAALRDPALLIMDEATSQVDADSERQINDAIREFGRGRTVVTVAHRLSTVLAADWIVVMDHGRIVDHGTHAELLARCSTYQAIATSQLTPVAPMAR